jgi:hypothetical protein
MLGSGRTLNVVVKIYVLSPQGFAGYIPGETESRTALSEMLRAVL